MIEYEIPGTFQVSGRHLQILGIAINLILGRYLNVQLWSSGFYTPVPMKRVEY